MSKPFQRFARKEGIDAAHICDAVKRAELGLIDADLGDGVIKQRIARPGEGKSGGFRSIILYRQSNRAFLVYGFAKSDRENIGPAELSGFKKLAGVMLNYDDDQLNAAVQSESLKEVNCDE